MSVSDDARTSASLLSPRSGRFKTSNFSNYARQLLRIHIEGSLDVLQVWYSGYLVTNVVYLLEYLSWALSGCPAFASPAMTAETILISMHVP